MEEIKEEEVTDAKWALDLDKEPRLDGFSISFYSSSWFLIKEVLIRMLHWARIMVGCHILLFLWAMNWGIEIMAPVVVFLTRLCFTCNWIWINVCTLDNSLFM